MQAPGFGTAAANHPYHSDQQSSVNRNLQALRDANISLGAAHGKKLEEIERSLRRVKAISESPPDADAKDSCQQLASMTGQNSTAYLAEILKSLASAAGTMAREQTILSGLHFNIMKARQETIAEAYVNTFKWIFPSQSQQSKSRARIHFFEWLSMEDGFFWISGKPGSGKSTLMKYLCDHPRTRDALSIWAQQDTPVISAHFFWCSGTPIQKSQEGLLRSLLYDVFKQCPDIVKRVCPDRWEAAARQGQKEEPWTLSELRQSLQKLSFCFNMGVKFCFFIDGLDEYDGNHSEIIKSLALLADSRILKFCVSSRPWNVFEDAYGKDCARKLYMQDLTHSDISYYVQRRLKEHSNWALLASDMETEQYQDLVTEITTKAQGVFLWIYLVVRSLHEGLTNGDSVSTLQRRIRTLPADLEQYFKHILDSVDPLYRQAMIRTFHVATSSPKPLPLIMYHFLSKEFENDGFSLQAPVHQLSHKEIDFHHERTRRQLNGRCKGLLEVHKNDSERTYLGYQVDFLHRTVRDFLRTKEMDEYLTPEHQNCGPSTSTLKGFAALLKSIPFDMVDMSDGGSVSRLLADTFYFAYHAELESGKPQTELLDDIHLTLRLYSSTTGKRIPWYSGCYESHQLGCHPRCEAFLEFAIQKGLSLYVRGQLGHPSRSHEFKRPLLHSALRLLPPIGNFEPDLTSVVRLLLDAGHGPNQKLECTGETAWCSFLAQWAQELSESDCQSRSAASIHHRRRLIELLLSRGADPNVRPTREYTAWYKLLLSTVRYPLPVAAISDTVGIFEAFFQAGADIAVAHFIGGSDLPHFLRAVEASMVEQATMSTSDRQAKLEFLSKIFRLLLKHGADPDSIDDSKISKLFPARLVLPILDLLAEKRQAEAATFRDAVQEQPFSYPTGFGKPVVEWAKSAAGFVWSWAP